MAGMASMRAYALQGLCVSALVVLLAMAVARWADTWPALQGFLYQQSSGKLISRGLFLFILLAVGAEWLVKGLRKLYSEHRALKAAVYSEDGRHAQAYKDAADKAQAELLAATDEAIRREAELRASAARQAGLALEQEQRNRKMEEAKLKKTLAERAERDAAEAASVREEVRQRRSLRMQQDQEYEEALQRDRLRQKKEDEERERKERLRRQEMESLEYWKKQLPEEPPSSTADATTIRLKYRDSSPKTRRFALTDDVSALHVWVKTCEVVKPGSDAFSLVMPFPRQELPRSGQTLRELGLFPQAVVAVELP